MDKTRSNAVSSLFDLLPPKPDISNRPFEDDLVIFSENSQFGMEEDIINLS